MDHDAVREFAQQEREADRKWFAGLALQGILAAESHPESGGVDFDPRESVDLAVKYAEAMIDRLAQQEEDDDERR